MQKYQMLTDMLVRELYPNVEEFTKQKKGCSADYIIDGQYCLEVKLDLRAKDTGNIFVEYANKNQEETYDSGISLSAKWDYNVLYLLPEKEFVTAYEIPAKTLLEIAEKNGKSVETRPGVNGNRAGFSALGYKVKTDFLKEFFKGVIKI